MATAKKPAKPKNPTGSKLVVNRVQDGVLNQLVETDLGGDGEVTVEAVDGVVIVTISV